MISGGISSPSTEYTDRCGASYPSGRSAKAGAASEDAGAPSALPLTDTRANAGAVMVTGSSGSMSVRTFHLYSEPPGARVSASTATFSPFCFSV